MQVDHMTGDAGKLFDQPGMLMLEAMGEAVLGLDQNGRCVYASDPMLTLLRAPGLETLLGRPVEAVLKRNKLGSLPSWDQCLRSAQGKVGGGLRSEYETLFRHDGVEIPVEIGVFALPGDGAHTWAVLVKDIGERSRQAKAFHASVRSFRELFDSVTDAIFFLSRQGRVLDANEGVKGMFGHAHQAFQGKSIDNIYAPDLHPAGFLSERAARAVDGELQHVEFTARDRRDGRFPAEIYLYPSQYFGQKVAMAVVHDVTERKRYEAAILLSRDQARESSELKSQFIANLSHEFRTPMNAILGMSELLRESQLDEEQRGYVDEILGGAGRLLGVLNSILEHARLETGQYQGQTLEFDIAGLFDGAVQKVRGPCRDKGLSLRQDTDPALPLFLAGDVSGLTAALGHLLDNAAKFTDTGEILLSARLEAGPDEAGRCLVRFAVRDTGIGIPEDKQARIFEAYVQGDGSATRRHGGNGLGLSCAQLLVRAMGGELAVDSAPGAGSEFHFCLPLQQVEW